MTSHRRNRLSLGIIFLTGCFASPTDKKGSAAPSSDGAIPIDTGGQAIADGSAGQAMDLLPGRGLDATASSTDGAVSGVDAAGGADGVVETPYDSGATGGSGGSTRDVDAAGGTGGAVIVLDATQGTGGMPDAAPGTGGMAGGPGDTGGDFSHPDVPTIVDSPLLFNGSVCTSGAQCSSNHCVDGVCCDGACDGQCEACDEAGSIGVCSVVSSGKPRGTRGACEGSGKCEAQCDGTSGKACAYPGSAVVCQRASCSNGTITSASVCNGSGACTAATTSQCSSNMCATDGTAKCSSTCTAASCGSGYYCDATGVCTKLKDPGTVCSAATECASGFCADGVCCSSACTGQCRACNGAGTCIRITGIPRNGRTACTAIDTNCGGTCDGSADTCVYPDSTRSCAAAKCTSDVAYQPASVCNGAGACPSPSAVPCSSATYCNDASCTSRVVGSLDITTGGPFAVSTKDNLLYVGDWQPKEGGNLWIIDLTNPTQLAKLGLYNNAAAQIHGLAIRDKRAYLANDTEGLTVVDIASPDNPNRLFGGRDSTGPTYAHAVTTGTFGSILPKAYALLGGLYGATLDAFDISDQKQLGPPIPYKTPTASARDIIDIVAVNDVGYLLLSDGSAWMGLETVDLRNLPQPPVRLGGVDLQMANYGGPGQIRLVGSTVYLATAVHPQHAGGLRTVDVSDSRNPTIGGGLDIADLGSVPWEGVGLDVVGARAYIVGKTALHVLDVSTPASLREVVAIPLPDAYVGTFGGSVAVSGDYAYAVVTTAQFAKGAVIVFRISSL